MPTSSQPTDDAEQTQAVSFPPLTEITFEEGYLEAEEIPFAELAQQQAQSEELSSPKPPQIQTLPLEPFTFETAARSPDLEIQRSTGKAQQFIEQLPNGLTLAMVLIPSGTFLMGAPEAEPQSRDSERPQHLVTVPEFLMGRYPMTQAQWWAIAELPKVNIDLNPNPAKFTEHDRGDRAENRPVECVTWHEAIEACDRLSHATGRPYGLPSEAQWEYACRAGATKPTPFCFGEPITPELANYDGNYTYANGPKGASRQRTTAVGSFPANAWGLHDMHGNVWEWCADLWHSNYQGAPTDGSAWTSDSTKDSRPLRGGSWSSNPRNCRSAVRVKNSPDSRFNYVGFRVCCAVAQAPEAGLVEE